jgi:AcrR family transcriptional regulator
MNSVHDSNMVQVRPALSSRRERNRLARHRTYLQTALRLATDEGLDALTMQRLADEMDAAVGTVYSYFSSKGALVAEVQREAIERLTASYLLLRPDLERRLADAAPPIAALAHLIGFARFWIASVDVFPQEQRLLQAIMSNADRAVPDDEAIRVVPAAMRLLELARERFAHAVEVGALTPAEPMERTVVLAAALSGVLQLSKLRRWDPDLLDGSRLAPGFVDELLVGWGAAPADLAAAHAHVDWLAHRQPLARETPQESP